MYMSVKPSSNSRGKPLGRWTDMVKEYICKRSATKEGAFNKQGVCLWIGKGRLDAA